MRERRPLGAMSRPAMLTAAAILTIGAGALGACTRSTTTTAAPQTVAVERRDIVVDVEATGVVEPVNVVEVKSKASGQIMRMPVETGDQVRPGDLLVQLDMRDVRAQFDQAQADERAAEARLAVSESQRRRADDLASQRIITQQEHEASTLDYANAQAQLVRARASLDQARQRLEDATVRAPVAGTIIEKTVSEGQVIVSATSGVSGGTTILKMADLNRVRVRVNVSETDIGKVSPGQAATVTTDAHPNRPFRGTVEKIEPQAIVQQSVTMFPILVTLDNRDGLLKPGMNAEVSILVERRENVLAIPNDAVRTMREAMSAAGMLGISQDSMRAVLGTGAGGTRPQAQAPAAAPGFTLVSGSAGDASLTQQARGEQGRQGGAARRPGRAPGAAGEQPGTGAQPGAAQQGPAAGAGVQLQQPGEMPSRRARGRQGVVFVAEHGGFTPRMVMLGTGNFDYTEVLNGVSEGEQVAMLGAIALQAQRQEMNDRMRQMRGGIPGMQRDQPQQQQQQQQQGRAGGGPAVVPR